jgi:hypothetical protein
LCENCARAIDGSPAAWTTEGLRCWKDEAERRAARDSRATADEVADLIDGIEATTKAILQFSAEWHGSDPSNDFDFDRFEDSVRRSTEHSWRRRAAYHDVISPLVTEVAAVEESERRMRFAVQPR